MNAGYNYNCHTGSIKVIDGKYVEVYGGGTMHHVKAIGMDYVFDLAGMLSFPFVFPVDWGVNRLFPKIINMKINDNSAPAAYDMEFWKELWLDLSRLGKEKAEKYPGKKLKTLH